MAFIDEVTIEARAGKGGDGVVRWLHTKEKAKGGPGGGDGGRGGDVLLVGARDLSALATYRFAKKFRAEDGEAGRNELQQGKDGSALRLRVPIGTVARVLETGSTHELTREDEEIVLFKGGTGGRGNAHYKSSTNQNPWQHTTGKEGGGGEVVLSLKLIAHVGLIGLPNAGKSSLLNALTHARSKIGAYPFTTLEPHLGDFFGYILADIPGLIEGASAGRGLGTKFLKHIERTSILLHLVSAEQEDPLRAYREVREELERFGEGLAGKEEYIVLSKIDLISTELQETYVRELRQATSREVLTVSVMDPASLKTFSDRLSKILHDTVV